ncbi:GvpL/GvpF family gas vesicle protein [Streptomyces puniciscabiei]
MATVYLDELRVRDVLREQEASFAALLERLADQEEWGVKVYAGVPADAEPAPCGSRRPGGGARPAPAGEGGPPL